MTKHPAITPAQYAAAFLAAVQEAPAPHQASLIDGFLQVLEEDGVRSATREIIGELATQGRSRSARIARAEERATVTRALGDSAVVTVDTTLIGGAVIRSGETEVDGSIAGHLRRLVAVMKN